MDEMQELMTSVFDRSAEVYETYWAPQLHRHARHLLDGVRAPEDRVPWTVVDVAAGVGSLVPGLLEVAGPGGRVLAMDRSLGMLRRAPSSARRVQSDAMQLPLADGCADVVVQSFVLFMLPDARVAVHEAARVLRRGGRLLAATWGEQKGSVADRVVREELDAAGAPSYPVTDRSDELTDSPARMRALLGGDFEGVRTTARTFDARFDAETVLAMRLGGGVGSWRLEQLAPKTRACVRDRVAARLAGLDADGFVDRSQLLLTTATRC